MTTTTGKFHLKRTPAEEAERESRRARKAARKAHKSRPANDEHDSDSRPSGSTTDRKRNRPPATLDNEDDEIPYGPPPPDPSYSCKPDYDEIRAHIEEERFREKMWGAFEDDERLDSVEARFNDFAHVPQRWRTSGHHDGSLGGEPVTNPHLMDDDEYAEWIREGMWRKTHAQEFEEQARKESEKAARRARDAELKAETRRLRRAAEEDRRRKKSEKDRSKRYGYRLEYDRRWKELLEGDGLLTFEDIPWPSFVAQLPAEDKSGENQDAVEGLTAEDILAFLIPISTPASLVREAGVGLPPNEQERKERKEKLREAMLRFHPDKFEGRILHRVTEKDRSIVKEAADQVTRSLTTLMGS